MNDIIKVTVIFVLIIYLLKKRWNLGAVMAISSVGLSFLYLLPMPEFFSAVYTASTDKTTISLVVALTLIRVFENIMRTNGIMQKMMDSLRGIISDRRILIASMPALIGLLPSLGGALFSAPMVDETSKEIRISPEKKAFINYMFRHPWEFILPLYPGVILASAITGHSLRALLLANLPYALCLIIGGAFWGLKGIGRQKEGFRKISGNGLLSFLPLMLILLMVMAFHIHLSISLGIVIAGLYVALHYSFKKIMQSLKEGISWEIIAIIFGAMTFKTVLGVSGAVSNISSFFVREGIPVLPVMFILPFISGLLTGLTVGFVGSTFPIILGLENTQHIGAVSFAFASGYAGVLLSPVHLCLVLTREYFKAEMSGIYKKIIKVVIMIMTMAAAEYFFIGRYWLAK